ncbi:hypothetical protein ACF06X_26870 [Streptomyces sp. NPDC015346]
MSTGAVAARAGVGKDTVYRRQRLSLAAILHQVADRLAQP